MTRIGRVTAAVIAAVLLLGVAPASAAPGPSNAPEYWFDEWHLPQLWATGSRGGGVTIAEIDTGVNASLPALTGKVLPGKDFGQAGDGRIDRELDAFGHGTAMASIMVAAPSLLGITGIAPDAKLLPIAVPLTGTARASGDDHLAQAIRWSADHGGKIISMSLGGTRQPAHDREPCPSDEQAAVYYALRKGAVLLASSGNNGLTSNAVEEPGVCLGVISVGAVDSTQTPAGFSSKHRYLTLTAPGVNIPSLSRVSGSAYSGDGTSQATAIASAVVALVWSKYPQLTGRQVVARVLATLDRHRSTRDPGYGFGIVNAYRAITASVAPNAPNPVYAAADPFLARIAAFDKASQVPVPKPAAVAHKSVGTFSIGNAPRLLVPDVLRGLAVAAAGLLALIVLFVAARMRRRRWQVAAAAPVPDAPTPDGWSEPSLTWREIVDPDNEPDPSTR